ncbi:hypothetical protein BDR06DRAFT_947889 [Suillus hirtellus]|nr:hypothetical protein BDR06DRAFT_947889 [Suillus hirtellus]
MLYPSASRSVVKTSSYPGSIAGMPAGPSACSVTSGFTLGLIVGSMHGCTVS